MQPKNDFPPSKILRAALAHDATTSCLLESSLVSTKPRMSNVSVVHGGAYGGKVSTLGAVV
jgi:hypothetical protein